MKQRVVIFPCNQELATLSGSMECDEYDIVGLVVIKQSDVYNEEEICLPLIDVDNMNFDSFDSVVLVDKKYRGHPFIDECIQKGKHIDCIGDKKIDINYLNNISDDVKLTIPVIFVVGVSPCTEKFQVQLALRQRLQREGYKVGQIGNKKYSDLFGIHSYPFFMEEDMDNTTKIVLLKKYVKYIEIQEHPDLIIIGIPGGIMSINRKHHFDFGLTAYMISQAIDPDYVVMSLLYSKKYNDDYFEEIKKICRYRLNFEIDSFHLSDTFIDPSTLKSERIKFLRIENKEFKNKFDYLYDFLNSDDMDIAFEKMIDKLAAYNINQIL